MTDEFQDNHASRTSETDTLHRENLPDICDSLKKLIQESCTRELIMDRLPILKWLPKYKITFLFYDFIAGITVGLTSIPQSIAYAIVAGLEPQYGLYSAYISCFVYCVFGSCKDVTIGTTAIMALMVHPYVIISQDFAFLATFITGFVILLCGILNLGFIIQFISIPVTGGFVTAAAMIIGSGQIKSLLGIKTGKSNDFIGAWINVFQNYGETKLWDTVLGVSTIFFLYLCFKSKDIATNRFKTFFKYLSLSRNALAVIFGTLLAFILTTNNNGISPFILTGKVASGFPFIQPPPFSTTVNGTTWYFGDMLNEFGTSVVGIPVVAILEIIAVSKAFSKGKIIDATQEMLALGMCNIIGSFFLSLPTTGSFTRTALNNASGVKTTFGGVFTGVLVLSALGLLTQTFYFIPKTTLAAVIISAMYYMLEFHVARETWRTRRIDSLPFIVTLISCLGLGLEYGILVGISSNLILILYKTARPNTTTTTNEINGRGILMITPDQSLIFSAAEFFRNEILKHSLAMPEKSLVIVNGEYVQYIDTTVVKNLKIVVDDLREQKREILFWKWREQPVGVAHRFDGDFGRLFVTRDNLDDVVNVCNETSRLLGEV